MFTNGFYAWATGILLDVPSADDSTLRSSPDAHIFDLRAGEVTSGEIVEVPVDPVDD